MQGPDQPGRPVQDRADARCPAWQRGDRQDSCAGREAHEGLQRLHCAHVRDSREQSRLHPRPRAARAEPALAQVRKGHRNRRAQGLRGRFQAAVGLRGRAVDRDLREPRDFAVLRGQNAQADRAVACQVPAVPLLPARPAASTEPAFEEQRQLQQASQDFAVPEGRISENDRSNEPAQPQRPGGRPRARIRSDSGELARVLRALPPRPAAQSERGLHGVSEQEPQLRAAAAQRRPPGAEDAQRHYSHARHACADRGASVRC